MVRKLQGLLWAIGMVSGMTASAAAQEPLSPGSPVLPVGDSPVETLRERPQPATTVKEWVAQIEAAAVQVTGIKLERSATGLDIVLETAAGKPLQVDATKFRREGNNLIAEIPNAVLALPQGQTFTAENPTADIATVQVVQRSGDIRVSVAGNNALPKTEVTLKTGGLAYSLNPERDEPDEEIVVTGDRVRGGYRVPNASTGSRTDTPIRDLPFSVQVVPLELLQDRQVQRVNEALRTIAGVTPGQSSQSAFEEYTIRGFSGNFAGGNILRNGLRDDSNISGIALPNIEQIEVLKGPAVALFGQGSSGGTVNIITKKPALLD
jgi:iron complex outermembrane receptor protein